VVALGDREGKPSGKAIGYYQVSLDPQNKRVILDLAQLKLSSLSEPQLKNIFKKSPYVASTELTLDPEDKAGTLVLHLKQPVKAEVFELLKDRQPSRVVIDLKPVKS
jgi:hypothetical protein